MRRADDGLRGELHDHLPRIHWQAIEVGLLAGGVPDTNFCGDGAEGWVECKATESHSCDLRTLQVGWILRRRRARGRVLIMTRRRHDGGPRKGLAVDELWIHDGAWAGVLRAGGLLSAETLVLTQSGGPSRWDWGLVEHALLRLPLLTMVV